MAVLHYWSFALGIHRLPVDTQHKGPVIWKVCHGAIDVYAMEYYLCVCLPLDMRPFTLQLMY